MHIVRSMLLLILWLPNLVVANEPPTLLKIHESPSLKLTNPVIDLLACNPSKSPTTSFQELIKDELSQLNNSIKSIKPEPESFWQQIQPYMLAVISTIFGVVTTLGLFLFQERIKVKTQNLCTANRWILHGLDIFHSLERYKRIYTDRMAELTDPLARTMAIPELRIKIDEYKVEISELVFLIGKDEQEWDLHRIRALFTNFNMTISLWEMHSAMHKEIADILLQMNGDVPFSAVDKDVLLRNVPRKLLIDHVFTTELAIKLTDDLLIECHKFFTDLPKLIEHRLGKGRIFKLGPIIRVDKITDETIALLRPVAPTDIVSLARFSGYSEDNIKRRLFTGYPFVWSSTPNV